MTMRSRTQTLRALSGLVLVLVLPEGPRGPSPVTRAPARLPAERVTLNLRDASVPTALRLLAQQYKVNLLVTEDVRGQVTLDFFQVPAHDVFQAIIDASNLRCVVSGDVLRVSTMTRLRSRGGRARQGAGRASFGSRPTRARRSSRPGAPRRSSPSSPRAGRSGRRPFGCTTPTPRTSRGRSRAFSASPRRGRARPRCPCRSSPSSTSRARRSTSRPRRRRR